MPAKFDPRMALFDGWNPMGQNYGYGGQFFPGMAGWQNMENGYGDIHKPGSRMLPPQAHGKGVRRQQNCVGILLALLVPFGFFVACICTMSFETFYRKPYTAMLIVAGLVFIQLLIGAMAVQAKKNEMLRGTRTWYYFVFMTGMVAIILGACLGYINQDWFAVRYYDYMSLRKVVDVDPGLWQGQQVLDAGEVDFQRSTHLDLNLKSSWHKGKTYCVAPIISRDNSPMVSYDFWAVGMDCCSPAPNDFSCGETYLNWETAGSLPLGLRVLDNAEIQGYKLAVEQATASNHIQAANPIFLYMMPDPYAKIRSYFTDARTFVIGASILFFLLQSLLVWTWCFKEGKGRPSGYLDSEYGSNQLPQH